MAWILLEAVCVEPVAPEVVAEAVSFVFAEVLKESDVEFHDVATLDCSFFDVMPACRFVCLNRGDFLLNRRECCDAVLCVAR